MLRQLVIGMGLKIFERRGCEGYAKGVKKKTKK
jgi:hypothetical protein